MDLDQHYQPRQTESISYLLRQLKELADIFLKCLTNNAESSSKE